MLSVGLCQGWPTRHPGGILVRQDLYNSPWRLFDKPRQKNCDENLLKMAQIVKLLNFLSTKLTLFKILAT